jgi:hypothetical protein
MNIGMELQNLNKLKAKKFLSLGYHNLPHVGDLSKPFFITVGCSHTKGDALDYSDTWSSVISNLLGIEHINLGFEGSSLDYQLNVIEKAETVLPQAKFILWMHTYPLRGHKHLFSSILGDKLCRRQIVVDKLNNYNLTCWNKIKMYVDKVKDKKVLITNCWGYDSGINVLIQKKICNTNLKYFFNQEGWSDYATDNTHAGPESHKKLAKDWYGHITKHFDVLIENK